MRVLPRVRRLLRPVARAARLARVRAGRLVRPPAPWDGRHHPALLRFPPWRGIADGRYRHDFLGIRTDPAFRVDFSPDPPGPLETAYPVPAASYFELTFVLDSVLAARGPFTMMELGAGYGPWTVVAHRAMQRSGGHPVRLIALEMDPQHHRWISSHLRDNGIDPERHRILHGALGAHDGTASYVPETDPGARYGQTVLGRRASRREPDAPADRRGGAVLVPSVSLRGLLERVERVDLIHMDVQGNERVAIEHAGELLERKVRRLLVATHSRGIHRALRHRLRAPGWRTVLDFPTRSRQRTRFGDVYFVDGLLAAENERLADGDRPD